jgi:hypothetical protein
MIIIQYYSDVILVVKPLKAVFNLNLLGEYSSLKKVYFDLKEKNSLSGSGVLFLFSFV